MAQEGCLALCKSDCGLSYPVQSQPRHVYSTPDTPSHVCRCCLWPTGSQFVSLPHAGRPQRRNRYNGSLAHVQSQGQTESRVKMTKSGSSAGRDRFHDETSVHRQRADQDPAKASSQNRVHGQQSVVRRVPHGPTNSPGDTLTKVCMFTAEK